MSEVEYLEKILEIVEMVRIGNLIISACVGLTLGFVVVQAITGK